MNRRELLRLPLGAAAAGVVGVTAASEVKVLKTPYWTADWQDAREAHALTAKYAADIRASVISAEECRRWMFKPVFIE